LLMHFNVKHKGMDGNSSPSIPYPKKVPGPL